MGSKLLTESDLRFLDSRLEEHINQVSDNRTWESYVEDIDGGDNFVDYCEYFFEMLDEEDYWEN